MIDFAAEVVDVFDEGCALGGVVFELFLQLWGFEQFLLEV